MTFHRKIRQQRKQKGLTKELLIQLNDIKQIYLTNSWNVSLLVIKIIAIINFMEF